MGAILWVGLGVCVAYVDLCLGFRVEFGVGLGVSAVDIDFRVDLGVGLGVSAVEVDLYLGLVLIWVLSWVYR